MLWTHRIHLTKFRGRDTVHVMFTTKDKLPVNTDIFIAKGEQLASFDVHPMEDNSLVTFETDLDTAAEIIAELESTQTEEILPGLRQLFDATLNLTST